MVCEIRCASCGKIRVINVQDAFQARFCGDCRKVAMKEKGATRRAEKRLEGKSVDDLRAEIAEAQKALEALSA